MENKLIIKQSKIISITSSIDNDNDCVEFILAVPTESNYVPEVNIPSTYKEEYNGILKINTEAHNYYEVKERTSGFIVIDTSPNLELYTCYDLCISAKLVNNYEIKGITELDYKKINSYLSKKED